MNQVLFSNAGFLPHGDIEAMEICCQAVGGKLGLIPGHAYPGPQLHASLVRQQLAMIFQSPDTDGGALIQPLVSGHDLDYI